MNWTLICIIIVVVLLLLFFIGVYNSLVKLREQVNEAFKKIDVQLKRRADLFGNLMETVKGYAGHESDIYKQFASARNATMQSSVNPSVENQKIAQATLGSALQGMRAIQEQYPELKADQRFAELQKSIEGTENDIQNARDFYNGGVKEYNVKIKVFPNVIFASMLGFTEKDYWDSGAQEELDKGLDTTSSAIKF